MLLAKIKFRFKIIKARRQLGNWESTKVEKFKVLTCKIYINWLLFCSFKKQKNDKAWSDVHTAAKTGICNFKISLLQMNHGHGNL